jgi:hypothetical protein
MEKKGKEKEVEGDEILIKSKYISHNLHYWKQP